MVLAQTPVNLQLTSFNMAAPEDASMPDASTFTWQTVDLSDGAAEWLASNQEQLEALVQRHGANKVYSLAQWQVFQDWAYNEHNKRKTAERELETLRTERRQMSATIDRLEKHADRLTAQSRGRQLSSLEPNYRTGINALTRLVLRATKADERTLTDATHLMDHIDRLVDRMIVEEHRRMGEEQRFPPPRRHQMTAQPGTPRLLCCITKPCTISCTFADVLPFFISFTDRLSVISSIAFG